MSKPDKYKAAQVDYKDIKEQAVLEVGGGSRESCVMPKMQESGPRPFSR